MSNFLDELFRAQPATALVTNTGALVDVAAADPPVAGDTLQAIDATHALWLPATGVDSTARAAAAAAQATANAAAAAVLGSAPLYLQPASPHVDDVEFTSNTAPAGFVCRVCSTGGSGGQAMALGSSAPNPYSRLSQGVGNVVFNTQRASWMHLQSWPTNVSNNPNPAVYCKPLTSPATNMFIWARIGALVPIAGYDGAYRFQLCFASTLSGNPDPSLWIGVGMGNHPTGGTRVYQGTYVPAGGTIGGYTLIPNNNTPSLLTGATPYEYVGIHKVGTTYHFWLFNDGGPRLHLGSTTQAGFTPTWFGFAWALDNLSATVPGTPINCADFIRRIDTAVFPF